MMTVTQCDACYNLHVLATNRNAVMNSKLVLNIIHLHAKGGKSSKKASKSVIVQEEECHMDL